MTIAETYDCSNSTAALLFDTMGFGLELMYWSPESPFAQMFNRAFRQVIYNMAATFDIDLVDRTRDTSAEDPSTVPAPFHGLTVSRQPARG